MTSTISKAVLEAFSQDARDCISNFQRYESPIGVNCGNARKAAVLVALFEKPEKDGLRVVLTTRAATLRSHANQTALPGGKMDETDLNADHTARREAYEEVGLPLGVHPGLHYLTELEPFISKYKIIVFPVVYLLSDYNLVTQLIPSPAEVAAIFDTPLDYCLTAQWTREPKLLAPKGGPDWPYEEEFYCHGDTSWMMNDKYQYRMNRLRSTHTPIKGLTSDILISVAEIAYDRKTTIPRFAPMQLSFRTAIDIVVQESREVVETSAIDLPDAKGLVNGEPPDHARA